MRGRDASESGAASRAVLLWRDAEAVAKRVIQLSGMRKSRFVADLGDPLIRSKKHRSCRVETCLSDESRQRDRNRLAKEMAKPGGAKPNSSREVANNELFSVLRLDDPNDFPNSPLQDVRFVGFYWRLVLAAHGRQTARAMAGCIMTRRRTVNNSVVPISGLCRNAAAPAHFAFACNSGSW